MWSTIAIPALLFLGRAAAQSDVQTCPSDCIASVFANSIALGCAQDGDQACACKAGINFNYAITDCINQSCTTLTGDELTAQANAAQAAAASDCAIATSVPSTPTPTPIPSPPPTQPVSAVVSSTELTSATPTTFATSTATTSATAQSSGTTGTSAVSAATVSTTASSSASASASTSKATGSTTASAAAAGATDATDATTSSSSSDLSVSAKAGIGAGAGVALVLAGIILCYVLAKKRKSKTTAGGSQTPANASRIPTMMISRPLPGSGRQYAHDVRAIQVPPMSAQSYSQEDNFAPSPSSSTYSQKQSYAPERPSRDDDHNYDTQARRYEDMVQRPQPRTMI